MNIQSFPHEYGTTIRRSATDAEESHVINDRHFLKMSMSLVVSCSLYVYKTSSCVGPENAIFWDVSAAVTKTNVFWVITKCGSSLN
jgi:hypothetical protein